METKEMKNKPNDIDKQVSIPESKNEEGDFDITTNNKACYITNQINAREVHYKDKECSTGPIIYQVPNPVKSFCGREQELEEINNLFQQNKIITITGMAGIGKTELAKNYVNNYRKKYQENLIWINGETEENLQNSFKGLAAILKITHENTNIMVQMVYSYFKNKIVIFVIDNVDSRKSIYDFLPSVVAHKDFQIFILITSLNNNWGVIPIVPLSILSQNVALNIFKNKLGPRFQKEDEDQWLEIAGILNYVPLVLQIAASHVREEMKSYENVEKTFNIKDYVNKLKTKEYEILMKQFPQNSENVDRKTIYTAVKISIERIEKMNSEESKVALNILFISSYLDASTIHYKTFLPMDGINNSEDILTKAYSILVKYSFINIRKEVYHNQEYNCLINIHRLVQLIVRYHQQQQNLTKAYYTMTLDMIPIAQEISKEYHLKLIFRHGEQIENISANYYFKKKPKDFLQHCIRFNCVFILKRIFDSSCSLKGKYLIWSKDLLQVAIQRGKICTFDLMIQYNSNVHKRYSNKWTLLHYASESADWKKIRRLTELGIEGNVVDDKGFTPLHVLCGAGLIWRQHNEADIIDCGLVLVKAAHANVNALDFNENSPLYYASRCLLSSVSKWLVKMCKADVNTLNKYGESVLSNLVCAPLIFKEDAKLIDIGRLLIAHGARTDIRVRYQNRNLLHLCIDRMSLPVVRWVVEECHIDVNSQDSLGDSALHILASTPCVFDDNKEEMINICKFLLEQGAKVDITNLYSRKPIQVIDERTNNFLLEYLS